MEEASAARVKNHTRPLVSLSVRVTAKPGKRNLLFHQKLPFLGQRRISQACTKVEECKMIN